MSDVKSPEEMSASELRQAINYNYREKLRIERKAHYLDRLLEKAETGNCRGPQTPKTTQNFQKKARSAFLF